MSDAMEVWYHGGDDDTTYNLRPGPRIGAIGEEGCFRACEELPT